MQTVWINLATATEALATSGVVAGGSGTECDPTHLYEVLGLMTNSLEHLGDGYFSCFKATVWTTREVLADLNEVDATYVDTILEVMRTWHTTVILAMTGTHTEDHTIWDAKCDTLDEATTKFSQVYETARITCTKAWDDQHKAIQEGDARDPVVDLLDWVLVKTRRAANVAHWMELSFWLIQCWSLIALIPNCLTSRFLESKFNRFAMSSRQASFGNSEIEKLRLRT